MQKSMLPGFAVTERGLDAGEQPHRPKIYILLESTTNGEQEPPQRNVIGNARKTHGAEVDASKERSCSRPSSGIILADARKPLATPVEFSPLEPEAVATRSGLEHELAGGHDFAADAVSGDDRNPISSRHPEKYRSFGYAWRLRPAGVMTRPVQNTPG